MEPCRSPEGGAVEQGRTSRFMYGGNWQCSERPLVVLCWGIFLSKSGEELLGIASAETGFASRRFSLSSAGVVRYARLSAWGYTSEGQPEFSGRRPQPISDHSVEHSAGFGAKPGARLQRSLSGSMQTLLVPAVCLCSAPRQFVRRCARLGTRFFSSPY